MKSTEKKTELRDGRDQPRFEIMRYPRGLEKPAQAYRYINAELAVRATAEGVVVDMWPAKLTSTQAMTLAEMLMAAAAMRFTP